MNVYQKVRNLPFDVLGQMFAEAQADQAELRRRLRYLLRNSGDPGEIDRLHSQLMRNRLGPIGLRNLNNIFKPKSPAAKK